MPKMTIELPYLVGDEVWCLFRDRTLDKCKIEIVTATLTVWEDAVEVHNFYYKAKNKKAVEIQWVIKIFPTREAAEEWIKEKSNAKTD